MSFKCIKAPLLGRGWERLFLLLLLFMVSCEKIDYDQLRNNDMHAFYQQSETLDEIGAEACVAFCERYNAYVSENPKAKESKYFALIEQNITQALELYHLTINITTDDWGEEKHIEF